MSKPMRVGRKPPAVSIKQPCYTMATVDGDSAEIVMYGDIVESPPVDRWTGEPVPGNYIIESEFLEDLQRISGYKNITIRMNSCGGDAGVSVMIHNRLRELATAGVNLVCIVDGVAMSGGSLIMCACDTVKVNPASLIMIHKCWTFLFGGYNADELRQQASQNDAYDRSQVSIYTRKTGLTDTVLLHMMGDTTYMTGKEAVEKGFADEILGDAEPLNIAASADGRTLFIRGRKMHLAPGMFAPDSIPTVQPGADAPVETNKNPPENSGAEGGKDMTEEELRTQYPDLVSRIEAAVKAAGESDAAGAVQRERERLAAIDEVADLFDPELVREAKYGETACTAEQLAYRAAQKAAKDGKKFLADLDDDADNSGANGVGAVPGSEDADDGEDDSPEAQMARARAQVKGLFGKKEA